VSTELALFADNETQFAGEPRILQFALRLQW
jgi:hypothetical protein